MNISVVVKDDNKAVLYVALDRSDKSYYACDGGCLDDPVLLGYDLYYKLLQNDHRKLIL